MVLENEGIGLDMMTTRDRNESHALSCQRWLADPKAYDGQEVNVNLTIGYHSC
jgi:predicted 2-oxoglutarate/Fe(II)-dependent dioxygenase YbiX